MTIARSRASGFFYGYIVVLAVFFIMVVSWGTIYSFGVFFKPVSSDFGWTSAMTSGAYSAYMIIHGLLYVAAGKLNDRYGPRLVMTICGVALGIGYMMMSQISTIWQLYLYYGVIISIGMAGFFVPLLSMVARWFVKRRGLMTGVAVSGIGTGTMIMPPIASWLITSYGWSTSYMLVGLLALVVTTLAAQLLRGEPHEMGQVPYGEKQISQPRKPVNSGFTLGEALRTWQFWVYFFMVASLNFSIQMIIVHIVPHALGLKVPAVLAAAIMTVIGGASIIGRLSIGSTSDKIGCKRALIGCYVIAVVMLLWLTGADLIWKIYLFAVIFGFAYGGYVTLGSPMVAELFGLRSHGVIYGMATFGATLGGAVGPLVAGSIVDATGSYRLAFLTGSVMAGIGLALVISLKQTRLKKEPA